MLAALIRPSSPTIVSSITARCQAMRGVSSWMRTMAPGFFVWGLSNEIHGVQWDIRVSTTFKYVVIGLLVSWLSLVCWCLQSQDQSGCLQESHGWAHKQFSYGVRVIDVCGDSSKWPVIEDTLYLSLKAGKCGNCSSRDLPQSQFGHTDKSFPEPPQPGSSLGNELPFYTSPS